MGDETTFVPCHGPLSTFGNERKTNPYWRDLGPRFGLWNSVYRRFRSDFVEI